MKRLICWLLAACMLLALAGCGGGKANDLSAGTEAPKPTQTPPPAAPEETESDTQNPVMNFVGAYQCERARALVECSGSRGAKVTIEWGSSAWELARWIITGDLDPDTFTVEYSDCVKSIVTYDDSGELAKEEIEYENGTGSIVFHESGTFTWHEDQSEYGVDMEFEWVPVTE